jgi:predicted SAM-dependent methyltransferase
MQNEFKAIEKHLTYEVNGETRYKNGVDVGCGTNRISEKIVSVDQQPDPRYAHAQFVHDCKDLNIFADNSLDFIFSSHCLEDFDNISDVFANWWRKLKTDGLMVLLLPDMQPCDCQHCKGSTRYPSVGSDNGNPSHRTNTGKQFMNDMLQGLAEKGIIKYEMVQEDTLAHNQTSSIDFVIRKKGD